MMITRIVCLLTLLTTSMMAADTTSGGGDENKSKVDPKDLELIDKLEKSLLASFGLDERPRVDKSRVRVHPYMFQLYNQKVRHNLEEREMEGESEDDREEEEEGRGIVGRKEARATDASAKFSNFLANTVRSFTHSETSDDTFHPPHKMIFHFNVSSIPSREILRGAELRIMHFQHPHMPSNASFSKDAHPKRRKWSKKEMIYLHRIRVSDIVRPSRGHVDPINRLLDTRVVDARVNDTASFDISPAIKRWLSKPHTNYGILVEVLPLKKNDSLFDDTTHVRLRRNVDAGESSDSWSEKQPILVVHTDDKTLKQREREKRNAPISSYKRPHCRRYDLHVNFKSVDWDTWIVAPPGYDAFFCQGECPYPLAKHMNATNHAVIQNIIHSRYPNRVPSACCVPIKHSAISMLYLDRDSKVVLKTYQDMIVESCGCQ